ncbi:hypothetical protein Droror1_Dr00007392 [Drosera rotundifolia]
MHTKLPRIPFYAQSSSSSSPLHRALQPRLTTPHITALSQSILLSLAAFPNRLLHRALLWPRILDSVEWWFVRDCDGRAWWLVLVFRLMRRQSLIVCFVVAIEGLSDLMGCNGLNDSGGAAAMAATNMVLWLIVLFIMSTAQLIFPFLTWNTTVTRGVGWSPTRSFVFELIGTALGSGLLRALVEGSTWFGVAAAVVFVWSIVVFGLVEFGVVLG